MSQEHQQKTDRIDSTTRRGVLAALGSAGVLAALGGSAQADVGDGPDADEISHLLSRFYEGAESDLPDPGVEGRRYFVTDSGGTYPQWSLLRDDGSAWSKIDLATGSVNTDKAGIGDTVHVSPDSHPTFGDIVTELNNGKTVKAAAGVYDASDGPYSITSDHELYMDDNAVIDIPDGDVPQHYIDVGGSVGSAVDVTADVAKADVQISVSDSSPFEEGELAQLDDDASPIISDQNNGELVLIDKIIDGSTVKIREGAMLSHDVSANTVTLSPVTSIEGGWYGGTFDLSGVTQSNWPIMRWEYFIGYEFDEVSAIGDASTQIHQFGEIQRGLNFVSDAGQSVRTNEERGLFVQPGNGTKNCTIRNYHNYYGEPIEGERGGIGPAINPRFENIVSVGSQFLITSTVINATLRNCDTYAPYDDQGGSTHPGYRNLGVHTKFIDCDAYNVKDNAFELTGVGEVMQNCTVKNSNVAVFFGAAGSNAHPDALTETPTVKDSKFIDNGNALRAASDATEIKFEDCVWRQSPVNTLYDLNVLKIHGGMFVGSKLDFDGTPRIDLKDIEVDNDGNSGYWIDDTGGTVVDATIDGLTIYNGGSGIRLDATHTRVRNTHVPETETRLADKLLTITAGTNVSVDGVDARNSANGFDLAGATNVYYGGVVLNENGNEVADSA